MRIQIKNQSIARIVENKISDDEQNLTMLLQQQHHPDIENPTLTSGSEDNRQITIIPQNESMIKKHMNSVTKLKLKGVTLKGSSRGAALSIT